MVPILPGNILSITDLYRLRMEHGSFGLVSEELRWADFFIDGKDRI
jgi:hypothetical protein